MSITQGRYVEVSAGAAPADPQAQADLNAAAQAGAIAGDIAGRAAGREAGLAAGTEVAAQAGAAAGAEAGEIAGAQAGNQAGATAGASTGATAGATAGAAAAGVVVAAKADRDGGGNILNPATWRTNLGAVGSAALLLASGAGLVGWVSDATDAVYRLVSSKLTDVKSIKDFGAAAGNSAAANDAAIVKAIAWMRQSSTSGRQLTVPNEQIDISVPLTIPFAVGWSITGASNGASILNQTTDNVPVVKMTGDLTHSWRLSDLTLTYANVQPYANTDATCIQFATGAGSRNIFNFTIERVTFARGRRGISCDTVTTQQAVWGFSIRDNTFGSGLTGAAIYLQPNVSVGQPIMHFERLYIDCAGSAPNEAAMTFGPSESAVMLSVEFNNGTYNGAHPQIYAQTCFNVLVLSSKCEFVTVSAGKVIWDFPQSNVNVQNVCFNGINATGTGVKCMQATSGGSLSVSGFYGDTQVASSGTIFPYFASSLGVVQGVTTDAKFTEALRANIGNVAVPQLRVAGLTPNVAYTIPDAALAIALPTTAANLYRTTAARTANRTITLPSTNLQDGMVFQFYIRGADVASFSQTISDPLSGLNTTVAAGSADTIVTYRAISTGAYVRLPVVSDSLTASATYDPPALAAGQRGPTQTVTVTGAALGDYVDASFSLALQDVQLVAWVSAANTVSYYFTRPDALLTGSATYDPPSIAAAGTTTTTVAVTGAVLGDTASASFGLDVGGIVMTAYVSAADTVTVVFFNPTAVPIDLASGTLRVAVRPAATVDLGSGTVRARVRKVGT